MERPRLVALLGLSFGHLGRPARRGKQWPQGGRAIIPVDRRVLLGGRAFFPGQQWVAVGFVHGQCGSIGSRVAILGVKRSRLGRARFAVQTECRQRLQGDLGVNLASLRFTSDVQSLVRGLVEQSRNAPGASG